MGLGIEMEISGRFLPFDIMWSWEVSGIPILNLVLPPQMHSPDAWPEHQEPVIHMAQNRKEKKRKK